MSYILTSPYTCSSAAKVEGGIYLLAGISASSDDRNATDLQDYEAKVSISDLIVSLNSELVLHFMMLACCRLVIVLLKSQIVVNNFTAIAVVWAATLSGYLT